MGNSPGETTHGLTTGGRDAPQAASRDNVLVVMPAFNEEGQIGQTVRGVRSVLPEANVVVVDDGSADCTAAVAREAGAVVLSLPPNLGYCSALQTGYFYAAKHGADIVIQLDGDGQHAPESIAALLAAAEDPDVQVAIGSRFS